MKVKLLVSRAGNGFSQEIGQEITVGKREGKRLIDRGEAVPVPTKRRSTRVRKPAEKAAPVAKPADAGAPAETASRDNSGE